MTAAQQHPNATPEAFARFLDRRFAAKATPAPTFLLDVNAGPASWQKAADIVRASGLVVVHGPAMEALDTQRICDSAPEFVGVTRSGGWASTPDGTIAIFRRRPAPGPLRVLSIVTAYNEADVITRAVEHMLEDGLAVHVIDNWSTDGTLDAVRDLEHPEVTFERFPASGPSAAFEWEQLLLRVEEVGAASECDWIIHHDADERRSGPWSDLNLRESVAVVEADGFSAIGHTEFLFHPIDNGFGADDDVEQYFSFFGPSPTGANRIQLKAWKNVGRVDLHSSGGHDVTFPNRSVHPYNFLLKHYPIRSQHHGELKILRDRQARWDPKERARGWHSHYDHVRTGHDFLRDPGTLDRFTSGTFSDRLIERLSGLGMQPQWQDRPARRRAVRILRELGVLAPALRARKAWRVARRRHPETGRR